MRGGITLAKLARHKASSSADFWHIDTDRTSLDGVGARNSIHLTSNQAHASGVCTICPMPALLMLGRSSQMLTASHFVVWLRFNTDKALQHHYAETWTLSCC